MEYGVTKDKKDIIDAEEALAKIIKATDKYLTEY